MAGSVRRSGRAGRRAAPADRRSRQARGDGRGGAQAGPARARSAGSRVAPWRDPRGAWPGARRVTAQANRQANRSVLFWVQHLLGIGHLQRALRIADALIEQGIAVTVASGGMPQPLLHHSDVALVQLPPLRARNTSFTLLDEAAAPIDDRLRERRRAALIAILEATRPDAIVLEGFPFARRAFRFELDPLLEAVRAAPWRLPVICSVRDIVVVRNDPQRYREIVDRVRRDIDRILVHGDPALIPFDASFPPAPDIADRLVYTGYVAQPVTPRLRAAKGRAEVRSSAD